MITINNLEEIKPYYDKESNTYIFHNNVRFEFDLIIYSNIKAINIDANNIEALDINACNIDAYNINAWNINADDINADNIKANDIKAFNIDANNISFYAICCAYESLKCKSIKGRRINSKIICLDNDIEIK